MRSLSLLFVPSIVPRDLSFTLVLFITEHLSVPFILLIHSLKSTRPLTALNSHPLHLRPRHLKHILPQMLHPLHQHFPLHLPSPLPLLVREQPITRPQLARHKRQLIRAPSLEKEREGVAQLIARFEYFTTAQDVEPEAGAGQGDGEAADVAEVADAGGAR